MESGKQPKHIGIVACSSEGAALCYRTICIEASKLLGDHAHPEISLHSLSLADYVNHIENDDWQSVADMMLVSAQKLAQGGAEFLICPDNTIHQAFSLVEQQSPLPWLHIAEVVARQARERNFQKVGITGTRWLVESDVYPAKLSQYQIDHLVPKENERCEINRIIMDELVYGEFKSKGIIYCQNTIKRMKQEGCDAVVLGCTEIPLIINDGNSALPTLDSTRLLAKEAVRFAIGS